MDYCNDLWLFDFISLKWKRIEIDSGVSPGRRWQFSMDALDVESRHGAIVFGGHRLWHGFAGENSEENLWQSTDTFEKGGYLNDMWILTRDFSKSTTRDDQSNDGVSSSITNWAWSKLEAKETCVTAPGLSWEERNQIRCDIYWPKERSAHAAVYDEVRGGLWVHGGFTSHFPYPSSSSPGSGEGVKAQRKKGFIPFASHSYYLDDLWFYNVSSGYWKEMKHRKFSFALISAPCTCHFAVCIQSLHL